MLEFLSSSWKILNKDAEEARDIKIRQSKGRSVSGCLTFSKKLITNKAPPEIKKV